ncbi:MAG: DUF2993 domain-containing protein [Cryobacterium sp.]
MAAKRRGIAALVISAVLVLGLVVAFFIVDAGLRSYAQGRVKAEIVNNLPEGATDDVTVSIGGVSVIAQYLLGSFDRVELRAPNYVVNGSPAAVHIVAFGVPVDRTKPIRDVRGTVDLGQESVTALVAASGSADADLTLGTGTVSYSGIFPVFGLTIGYRADAKPSTSPESLLFTPTDAKLTTGIGTVDLSEVVPLILGGNPLTVCLAQYLPDGVTLTGVDVTPERARIKLESSTLMLTRQSLTTLGSCPAG